MLAIVLSLALFFFWLFVGRAVLCFAGDQHDCFQKLLLAPVTGVAVTVLPILWLNRLGAPVEQFASALTVGMVIGASLTVAWQRPSVPRRQLAALLAILVFTLVIVGRPSLEFGFDWVSYANSDMANYVLLAQQLQHRGFFEQPDLSALLQGTDYSQAGWFFQAIANARPGAQLVLAWVCSETGLTGHQAFMPTILALHLVLTCSTAALVYASRRDGTAALMGAALIGLSAITVQGTLNQLIAQVLGLALLAGCVALLLPQVARATWHSHLREGILISLLSAALCTSYPEVLPFLAVAYALQLGVLAIRRDLPIASTARLMGVVLVTTPVLLNSTVPGVLQYVLTQLAFSGGQADIQIAVFPMYLVPSGLATLWGLQQLDVAAVEPWQSASIIFGALTLVFATVAAGVLTWRTRGGATLTLVMLGVAAFLALHRSAFGIFKVAMFIQPFVLTTLVLACSSLIRHWRWRLAPVAVLGVLGMPSTFAYVETSRGYSTSVEIPNGSSSHVAREFQELVARLPPGPLLLDTTNITLQTFQVVYTRGREAAFPSRDLITTSFVPCADPQTPPGVRPLVQAICDRSIPATFSLHDPANPTLVDPFNINTIGEADSALAPCQQLIATTGRQSIFNRRQSDQTAPTNFVSYGCAAAVAANHLIFVHSTLGQNFFDSDEQHVGIFGMEPDPVWHTGTIAGAGRYLLFYVVNPSQTVRLVLDFTASLKSDGDNALPPASAIGTNRRPLASTGRGSARLFSAPISPQIIDGRPYVALDMGADGQQFHETRAGVMALYNTDIPIDPRRLTSFLRDVSLVSEDEYASLDAPSQVTSFPEGLLQPGLEYSGVYEDGWTSEDLFLNMSQPANQSTIDIVGMLPALDAPGPAQVRVLVDGADVLDRLLEPGEFSLEASAPVGIARRHLQLQFSRLQRLPSPDSRPVSVLLHSIAFKPVPPTTAPL